jgi:hypothetical protein
MLKARSLGVRIAPVLLLAGVSAHAQSFHVTCPSSTLTHPLASSNNAEPAYTGPTTFTTLNVVPNAPASGPANYSYTTGGYQVPSTNVNGAIKCQQVAGGDGYATMADGTQMYTFSFGPASGLADIANGLPGTQFPAVFNSPYVIPGGVPSSYSGVSTPGPVPLPPGYPAVTNGAPNNFNGAIGLSVAVANTVNIFQAQEGVVLNNGATTAWVDPDPKAAAYPNDACTVLVVLNNPSPFVLGDQVIIGQGTPSSTANDFTGYTGTYTVTHVNPPTNLADLGAGYAFTYELPSAECPGTPPAPALAVVTLSSDGTASKVPDASGGHIDPRQLMDVAVMNGNSPAPMMAIDEDDEFFSTLSNVGMIMRPDLFEQHTIHFHGYPNASPFYDGVPDASVAIWIGASFSYYYLAPDAGTYFWHCHITPPEHLQMGMVGQLYVRPRQDRVPATNTVYQALTWQQGDLRTACNNGSSFVPTIYSKTTPFITTATAAVSAPINDFECTNPLPVAGDNQVFGGFTGDIASSKKFAYNDGDGSTYYDVEYPLQSHGYDPNFHFVGMTFNPEPFADMKDKYLLLNGRGYPDTINDGTLNAPPSASGVSTLTTPTSDGTQHFSQPLNAIIKIPQGGRALIRYSELNVSEYKTLQSLGVPMLMVGWNAKLLRDQAGYNTEYWTNSITLGGGESADFILETCPGRAHPDDAPTACQNPLPKGTYYLYSSNLDHLSNDAENFGGMMTEVHVY